jgi:hypothetical protein
MKGYMNFKFGILLLVNLCIVYNIEAQQCGYEHRGAILLNIIDANTKQPIHGLKVNLSYADGTHVQSVGKTSYDDAKDETCIEEYLFWENESNRIKKEACVYTNLYRQAFPNAGNHYICIVPTRQGLMATSRLAYHEGYTKSEWAPNSEPKFDSTSNMFFMYIHIVDDRKHKKNGAYASQLLRIPLAAVIDICTSNIDGNDGELRNGQKLNPIQVVLKANDPSYKATIEHNAFDRYIIPYYHSGQVLGRGFEESHTVFQLQKIELYDEITLQLLQTITEPRQKKLSWRMGAIAFANFYREEEPFKKGFRIPAELTGKEIREDQRFVYYKWNTSTKLYELDTLLNSKTYTRFDGDTRRMFASEFEEKNDATISYHFELKDRKWILVDTERHENPKPVNPIVSNPFVEKKAKCYLDKTYSLKPVQYFKEEEWKFIRDTFWIGNYGNKTAKITVEHNSHFIIPEEILPNQKLPIVYERKFISDDRMSNNIYVVPIPFNTVTDYFSIRFNNDERLTGSMNYMIVDNRAMVNQLPDGSLNINIENGGIKKKIMHTFPSGFIKEYGEYYMPDKCRIGIWTQVDSSQQYPIQQVQYNKLLNLQVANADINKCSVTRIGTETEVVNRAQLAVSPSTKSIKISDGVASAEYKINFDELKQEDGVTLNLLKPNEDFVYNGQVKLPMDFSHQQYKIIFSPEYISSLLYPNKLSYEQHYFDELLKEFPALQYYNIDTVESKFRHRNSNDIFMVMDLSKCSASEKESVFKKLEKDNNIKSVCILPQRNAQFFNDNVIQIPDFKNQTLDTALAAKVKSYGFTFTNLQSSMSYTLSVFKYKSKIVDKAFFRDYNLLCEALAFKTIWLNRYANIKPENPEDNLRPSIRRKGGM